MLILFYDARLRQTFNTEAKLKRQYGPDNARVIARRLADIAAAETLVVMRTLPGSCEELKGGRKGQLSLRLRGSLRLIFEPADAPIPTKPDGGLDWAAVKTVRILEVSEHYE